MKNPRAEISKVIQEKKRVNELRAKAKAKARAIERTKKKKNVYRKSEDAEHESHFKEVSEIEQEKLVEVQQNRDLTSLDTRY